MFGCTTYTFINQGKLTARALKGLFISYLDVVFNEEMVLNKNQLIRATGPQNKTDDIVQFEIEQPIQKKTFKWSCRFI